MTSEITDTFVSERLRSIRRAQSLSLNDVEKASNGEIKAVVLGSYERGSRSLSIKRAIRIAHFYGVPVAALFGASQPFDAGVRKRVIIDTRRLKVMTENATTSEHAVIQMVLRYILYIQSSRDDWNGEVISLRQKDIDHLAICLGYTSTTLIDWLENQKLLLSLRN